QEMFPASRATRGRYAHPSHQRGTAHTSQVCGTEPTGRSVDGSRGGSRGFGDSATMEKCVMTNSKRRKGLATASALLGGMLVLTACSGGNDAAGGGESTSQAKADEAAAKKASEADIKITPADGSDNASINNAAKVTVSKGTLTGVTMTT